ncbi:MAG: response regulator, partial [Myxococcota bacterium]
LCLNARDAMPDGGTLEVRARAVASPPSSLALEPGHYVCLSVRDNGTGMDEATRQRAFEPYFTTRGPQKRTGMGLATAYGIVSNHRGTVHVSSQVGRGTEINVWLPLSGESKAIVDRFGSDAVPLQEPSEASPGTILTVDDEAVVLKTHVRVLEMLGYDVLSAPGGEEALRIYQEHRNRIRLVLLDLIMPGMRGEEVFRRLKELNPDVKVLILSGFMEDESTPRKLLEEGVKGFLFKPCDAHTLHQALAKVLGLDPKKRPARRRKPARAINRDFQPG